MAGTEDAVSGATHTLFSIAGMGFQLSAKDVDLLPEPDPAYEAFFLSPSTSDPACPVDIEIGDVGPPSGGSLLFETDELWKLYRDVEGYAFVLSRTLEEPEPYMVARYDRVSRAIHITCSEACLKTGADTACITNPLRYPLDQLLLNLYLAVNRSGLLVHGAGVSCGEKGLVLCGTSGAGKTTISRLLDQQAGLRVISDDRIVIRPNDDAYAMWGTPWPGEGGFALNESAVLCGICFLEHGESHVLESITAQQALDRLLPVASIPWYEEELMERSLEMVEQLLAKTPAHVLGFAPDGRVVELVQDLIHSG